MTSNVQAGVLQIIMALGLLYAFWSGALAVLIDGITTVIRGEPAPGRLFDAVTAGGRSAVDSGAAPAAPGTPGGAGSARKM